MCRFVGYLGPPVTLEHLLLETPHSLLRQSWQPRSQASGTVNADGFGVGWYDLSRRPEPALYRSVLPMWADRSFSSFAGLVESAAVMAAVRSATPPLPTEVSSTPPFADGPWLFAHNGAVTAFREGAGPRLRRRLTERREAGIVGASDSEVLFALALDRIDAGATPAEALACVVEDVRDASGGRTNMLLTDGRTIAATACGDSLAVASDGASVIVASEPFDDGAAWRAVPDGTVLVATAGEAGWSPL